ncbi:DUF3387 domain-containing protein [Limisphaera ngatamarikiensis]|uniref:DUF3387 domain-containing protein n=1 Tax=Limisphaera ngatamarikiensis TaxID=1324935 RepID=A0A6M1RV76_9BACT|nr:type I restriction enzyme endonuclease domain-containing protein [Limisphaera ngatamarikiensis]NGO38662.1 DUF3387 domain-containing protein [Limisphaera ngatamarikiensis]
MADRYGIRTDLQRTRQREVTSTSSSAASATHSGRAAKSLLYPFKENARARLRVLVKRVLRKHGYPPDKQQKATDTVLEQTEALCNEWLAAV